jgi:glycosyltransferase involved in cell wall biosynthesis
MNNTRMKIAIIWWWDQAAEIFPNWRDGHKAAYEEIAKKHDVDFILGKKLPQYKPDFLLFWDDSNSEVFNHLQEYNCRKGICLTTDPHNMENLHKLDVVFVESDPIYNAIRREGIRTIKAFGTDVNYFHPNPDIKKDIEYFYPATFSPWKLQREIAHLGDKLWCVGTKQPDGEIDYQACVHNGVHIEEGYFPVEKIREYYWRAKNVIIPSIHGSERTVLEAMACGN